MKCDICKLHLVTKIENNKLITYCPQCKTIYRDGKPVTKEEARHPQKVRRSK